MKFFATADFWKAYAELPLDMKQQARKAYKLWKDDSLHPSLHFKKVGKNLWSARISGGYRALALKRSKPMNYPIANLLEKLDRSLDSNSDPLRILLIGSAERITQTIHRLYSLGFADIGDWNPLLPLPNSHDLFSLLTRK